MPRLKTIRAFDQWKLEESNWEAFFGLIVEGELRADGTRKQLSLRDACMAVKQPYTLVYPFLHDGGAMQKRYEGVLAAMADDLMHERLRIADDVLGSDVPSHVQAAALACKVREENARSWGRERYGEAAEAMRGTTVLIQVAALRELPAPKAALADVSDAETVE